VIDQITPDLVPETDFELAHGDTMLLLTDGVVEHTGPTGMFGFDRVHAELAGHADRGPRRSAKPSPARLAAHGGTQDDDVTLLAFSYVGELDANQVS
jgi:serine phosphatase RsbU (regulator of sigma subunit)